jgi:hypothetical protein
MHTLVIAVIVASLFAFHYPDRRDEITSLNDTTINHLLDEKENE